MAEAHDPSRPKSGAPGWRQVPAGIWAIGFVSLLMDISSEMIHALLPVYMVAGLGVSVMAVGMIEGVAQATAAVTKVFSGAISDWLGKRKLLAVIGYGLAAVTKPIFPLASSLDWLIAARFIDRIGKGIRGAPRDALVADISPPHLRGASYGLRQSLDMAGAFIGPLLAILLMALTANHFQTVFWIAVIPAFLAVAMLIFAVKDPVRAQQSRQPRLPIRREQLRRLSPAYWGVIGIAAIFTLARFSEAFLVLRAQSLGLPLMLIPLVLVVMSLVTALCAYPVGALSDRVGRHVMLVIGLMLLLVSGLVLGLSSSLAWLTVGVALWGLHLGFTQGVLATLVADVAPPEMRGTAFGIFNLVTGAALLLASVIAGVLWDRIGPHATFLAGAAFTALALVAIIARQAFRQASPG